jgi:hypothetical protein
MLVLMLMLVLTLADCSLHLHLTLILGALLDISAPAFIMKLHILQRP